MTDKIKILLKNYGEEEKNTRSIKEYPVEFDLIEKVQVDDRESGMFQPEEKETISVNGYGYYSVIPQDELVGKPFKLYLVKTSSETIDTVESVSSEPGADRIRIIDASSVKHKNTDELFPDCDYGFVFYRCRDLVDKKVHFCVEIDDRKYKSADIDVHFSEPDKEKEQFAMIDNIWKKMPLLLTSVFQDSPLNVYLDKNSSTKVGTTIDTKIELLKRCVKTYYFHYSSIRKARKYKLSGCNYIDRIEKLTSVNSDTLAFISQNPQYLIPVNRKKGIKHNDKLYLPEKTLISKNVIDYNIYENRYIVSFIKMLLHECQSLKVSLKLFKQCSEKLKSGSSIQSKKNDFDGLRSRCQRQLGEVVIIERDLRRLSMQYESIFPLKNVSAKLQEPKATAIFRQLKEYNVFLKEAFEPWFKYGIQTTLGELIKEEGETFYTAVSNPSTTYEIYIVTNWIQYFVDKGYVFDSERASYAGVKEKESRYSDYAYEFVFYKEDNSNEEITLFYSPSVYYGEATDYKKDPRMNVDNILFRATQNSKVRKGTGEQNSAKGSHYEPDIILKYRKKRESSSDYIRYMMVDAKHKNFEEVRKDEMPDLIYKYLTGIMAVRPEGMDADIRIAGLCAVYNEHMPDIEINPENLDYREHIGNSANAKEEQFIRYLYMNVCDEQSSWKDEFGKLIEMFKNYEKVDNLEDEIRKIIKRTGKTGEEVSSILELLNREYSNMQ